MTFLTPLYLLAGLAVGLPILFHLIRRTPRGRQVFSSLMFLQPSPPRVTKRSRIEDWLLLLLRALAICLLVMAFSRPFIRAQELTDGNDGVGRRIVILLDTSASLQRDGLWEAAVREVQQTLDQLRPGDAVSFVSFDREPLVHLHFNDWLQIDSAARSGAVRDRLRQLSPTWNETELGRAMMIAADLLDEGTTEQVQERRMIVVSDFQAGSRWEALSGYEWPTGLQVELRPVDSGKPISNATLQVVASDELLDDTVRVRVTNSPQATRETFELQWLTDSIAAPVEVPVAAAVEGSSATSPESPVGAVSRSTRVYVPAGQSKIVRAPARPEGRVTSQLVLSGDDHEFDNACFITQREPWQVRILTIGERTGSGADSLRFYLEPVFPSTPQRIVSVHDWSDEEPEPPLLAAEITLLVITGQVTPEQLAWTENYLQQGGRACYVVTQPTQGEQLAALLGGIDLELTEAEVRRDVLLRSVDFRHPVFAPLSEPRYADLSKLRIWKYRRLDPALVPAARTLATLETSDPAILEVPLAAGKLIIWTTGWQRSDSELAVWSKFVPVMNGFLEYLGEQRITLPTYTVGETLDQSLLGIREGTYVLQPPPEADKPLSPVQLATGETYVFPRPGIYRAAATVAELATPAARELAVNLHPDESRLDPIEFDVLAAVGVPLDQAATQLTAEERAAAQRQLMNRELESKQQLWKWILVATIGILLLETALSGWKQRQASRVAGLTSSA